MARSAASPSHRGLEQRRLSTSARADLLARYLARKRLNQRAYRRREPDGLGCYDLSDLPKVGLEDMLRHARYLTVIEPTHADVTAALRAFIMHFIADHEANAE